MLVVASQYRIDCDKSFELELIDTERHRVLRRLIDRYAFRKRCMIDVHNGFYGRIRPIDVLRSGHLSAREKIYFLRKGLLARVRRYA